MSSDPESQKGSDDERVIVKTLRSMVAQTNRDADRLHVYCELPCSETNAGHAILRQYFSSQIPRPGMKNGDEI